MPAPTSAARRAYGLIQGTLDAQSAAFAYVDVFRFLAVACFGCGGVVLLMKRVRGAKGALGRTLSPAYKL